MGRKKYYNYKQRRVLYSFFEKNLFYGFSFLWFLPIYKVNYISGS